MEKISYDKLTGRNVLTATRPSVMDWKAVGRILNDAMPGHIANATAIDNLYWRYRGRQSIINRKKNVRPEIKNILIENRAFEIVEFKKGYEFSHPIQYTNASTKELDNGNVHPIEALNRYARIDGKTAKDQKLAEWFYISGTGYRICLPNTRAGPYDIPYFTSVLDPRFTFVVYSNDVSQKPLLACSYIEQIVYTNNGLEKTIWVYGIYTENNYFEWVFNEEQPDFTSKQPIIRPNGIGIIPITEFPLNESRIGYVELCASLCDALNTLGSNRLDAIEQVVQSLMVFTNCTLPEDDQGNPVIPRSVDSIAITSKNTLPADVKMLSQSLDQSQTQVAKEDYLNAIYEVCGVPDRKQRGGGGGDTGQAVILRDGWGAAEARAKSTENLFVSSELEYLKIVLTILGNTVSTASEVSGLSIGDVEIHFTRNRNNNMQVKAQTLEMLLASGVHPEEAYEYCELFSDPVAVWLKSKLYKEEQDRLTQEAQQETLLLQQEQRANSAQSTAQPTENPPNEETVV